MMSNPLSRETPRWWKGQRGEWYVVAQIALIALVFLGPRNVTGSQRWPTGPAAVATVVGVGLMISGFSLLVTALLRLGAGLTPLPYPKHDSTLIQTGPYAIVRHPMYGGGIALAYGWALAIHGWLTLIYATILFIFLDIKADREERWLVGVHPDYPAYQRRVRKLIPFLR